MWIMTTDFSELTPRQTRRVVRFTEPTFLTRSSPRADWRDAKLRGKTLFVVRHFVTLMAGTSRACSAVFETCRNPKPNQIGYKNIVPLIQNLDRGLKYGGAKWRLLIPFAWLILKTTPGNTCQSMHSIFLQEEQTKKIRYERMWRHLKGGRAKVCSPRVSQ